MAKEILMSSFMWCELMETTIISNECTNCEYCSQNEGIFYCDYDDETDKE